MASRTTTFWTFIVILVLLHLTLRVAGGLAWVPDLLVVAALLGARRLGSAAAAAYGLLLGVLADALAVVAFGASAVAYVVACFLGARSRNLFEGDSFLFTFVYVFFGAWLIDVLRFVVGGAVRRGDTWATLYTDMPLAALFTALAAFISLLAYRATTGHR